MHSTLDSDATVVSNSPGSTSKRPMMDASGPLLTATQPSTSWGKAIPVALSVLIYWTAVSMIPVYNKRVFAKGNYPYPVATATIQLAMVSLALGIVSIVKHLVYLAVRHGSTAQRGDAYEVMLRRCDVSLEQEARACVSFVGGWAGGGDDGD